MENFKPGDLQKAIREALPKFYQDYDKILRDAHKEWDQYFTEDTDPDDEWDGYMESVGL